LDPTGVTGFSIVESETGATVEAWIRPDSATCSECLAEILDPTNRRWRYPFTNCTHCGPRFSIIERLPYDRPNTSMKGFPMCLACEREYSDPANRRFHAQPNACPICGPQLALWDACGAVLCECDEALTRAADAICSGLIVAVKGLGGFHLFARADDAEAVRRLRTRKRREEKPLAVMFPSLDAVRSCCDCSAAEVRLLESPEAPIVLLGRRDNATEGGAVTSNVAPGQATLGAMLPYTPLHHLLLRDLGLVVVATSGNRSDEPICTNEHEARHRLRGIADLFLVHDRPIVRHVDDSLARVVAGREMVLRRARGFAPLPIRVSAEGGGAEEVVLGVGAHLKNSVALGRGDRVFVSQHVGDLETVEAHDAFRRVVHDLQTLYGLEPHVIAADLHPDYLSTRYAVESGSPVETVQHHLAHVAAVIAENEINGPVLGVSWDGTGLGEDRTIWGGEFLSVNGAEWRRVAHLRCFPLPGGDLAAREPRRSALGLAMTWRTEDWTRADAFRTMREAFPDEELELLARVVRSSINAPLTSSMGRLFDGVASFLGLRQRCAYEGQAAMELEAAADRASGAVNACPMTLGAAADSGDSAVLDWEPLLEGILRDRQAGAPVETVAAAFHASLVESVVDVARRSGQSTVVLSGGCFQNRRLLEGCVARLTAEGCRVYWPQRVPPNDGGVALGQVTVARWRRQRGK
jgi:hydrogenase maturation protein HypF